MHDRPSPGYTYAASHVHEALIRGHTACSMSAWPCDDAAWGPDACEASRPCCPYARGGRPCVPRAPALPWRMGAVRATVMADARELPGTLAVTPASPGLRCVLGGVSVAYT